MANIKTIQYHSLQKTHNITIEIDNNNGVALINEINMESYAPVELVMMLKTMEEELKNMDVKYIIQQVNPEDWDNILKSIEAFEYINKNTKYDYINVRCKIGEFTEAFMFALGYKK